MKISMRARILALVVGSGIVVASSACGVDTAAPTVAPRATTPERVSSFVPTAASKALVGVADGVYTVVFNPSQDQHFALGPNRLEIPAHAVCRLGFSGYGSDFWNQSCTPETAPVTLTVTVKGSSSDYPVVDFQPAMRFNPQTTVSLYFYVPNVSKQHAKNWAILYCGSRNSANSGQNNGQNSGQNGGQNGSKCVNEAQTDQDLQTYIDYQHSVLFRRIKHFSGYKVDSGYVSGE